MPSLSSTLWSSVGKKVLMAFTGLFWALYLVEHLIGNLLLLNKDPGPYNSYAHFILSFGKLLWIAEAFLVIFILVHIVSGISVWWSSRTARPVKYAKTANAGGPSRKTLSSMTMIYTGALLLIFMVIHVNSFKYGPHYTIMVNGVEMLDLHRVVYE
ncbi:succinate dehydrogenase, partial [candidate division KSB1 bacterium]